MKPTRLPILLVVLVQNAICGSNHDPQSENATVAVLRAFTNHDVVMVGEIHSNKEEYNWYVSLIRTPAFADRVDDIVLEMGNSLYQQFVDSFVTGENVSFEQVQKAWRNTVGLVGPPSPLVESLYGAVRETNMQRRGKHQMRIVCGDPAIDWDIVKNLNTVSLYSSRRDEWYAHVVQEQVLAKHHRALLIMGGMHFLRNSDSPFAHPGIETKLRKRGARTYVIVSGTNTSNECCEMDHRFDSWPTPSIISARGWVGELPAQSLMEGGYPNSKPKLKDGADAFLYLGPRDSLTSVSMTRTQLQGTAYGKEIERRLKIEMILQPDEAPLFPENEKQPQFPRP
jgi:nicotinamidase-related amidase